MTTTAPADSTSAGARTVETETKDLPPYIGNGVAGTGKPMLEVTDLHVRFDSPRGLINAVNGVSFSLDQGRTLGIVGESGSGKTVLSRAIMNLLPARTTRYSGSVRFEGQEILGFNAKQMRPFWGPKISMVFQDPMTSLNPVVKVGRQITESLRLHLKLDKAEARQSAIDLLRSVGIPDPAGRIDTYPGAMSGGMRQRVVIAIAMACSPGLLMADEPTTALDVTVQAQILDLLGQQQKDHNMSMVLVTHDLGVVAGRTDAICVMYAGRIVERAPTRTLFASPRHPYTVALMRSIPRVEQPSHTRLTAIAGRPPDLVNLPPGCAFAARCAFAQDRCRVETPLLQPGDAAGHAFACHFPIEPGASARPDAGASTAAVDPTAVADPSGDSEGLGGAA